ncbi:MAG TPA: helix-turn-helix transcriptional regulator [Burkholderiaceae bacterium]|nr:helix-turn-helix transcriptional regulator [Burkholderiaceae bacterium]
MSQTVQESNVATAGPSPADSGPVVDLVDPPPFVMTLEEFARRMPLLQPPCAYRLSLDSGVEFNNVKHAFEQPLAVRLDTWLRLLRSLGVSLVAATRDKDVASDDATVARVLIGAAKDDAGPRLAPSRQSSLQECRRARGLSMATLAHQVGVSIDTVTSVERGRGLLRNVARVCQQYSMALFVALPGRFNSVEQLWAAHAERYLLAPSQFPLRRPTRKFEAQPASPEGPPRRRTGPPRKARPDDN